MKCLFIIVFVFSSTFCFSQKKDSLDFKTDSTVILRVLMDLDVYLQKTMSYKGYVEQAMSYWLAQYYAEKQKAFVKPKSK